MSKTLSASLLADIQKTVTTLALAVTIRRRDGRTYHFTNHDASVVIDGETYRHDIAFDLPSIDSSSQLTIDNTQLVIYLDGTTFTLQDFEAKAYDNAECEIALYDYENPAHGVMSLRKGWFGEHVRNENNVVKVTVTGLLKVLDFEIGRTYQAACDATLGDKRCRVAIDQAQIYSLYNTYRAGDWVYRYDTALMTSIPLVNASFNADGARTSAQAITGWTRGTNSKIIVAATAPVGTLAADSTYALYGDSDVGSVDGVEHSIYQDITTAAIGMANADIDEGKLSMVLFGLFAHTLTTEDPARVKVEAFDVDGKVINTLDTRYVFLDAADTWRERAVAGPVIAGTRSFRVTLYMRREATTRVNCAIDTVRAYYWDHTLGTPYSGVIYQLRRIVDPDGSPVYRGDSFEYPASNAAYVSLPPAGATNWTGYYGGDLDVAYAVDGSWWQTKTAHGSLTPTDGSRMLVGGNDGSGTQRTDKIFKAFDLYGLAWQPRLDLAVVDAGLYYCKVDVDVGFNDSGCSVTIDLRQKDATNVDITSDNVCTNFNSGSTTAMTTVSKFAAILPDTRKMGVKIQAKSAPATGNNNCVIDNVRFRFWNIAKISKNDPLSGQGSADTVWDTTVDAVVFDNGLIWQARSAFVNIDVVASVTDRRTFAGTAISGADGAYESSYIRWISGSNANQTNLVRSWTSGSKTVKTYFRAPHPIQVGDRFVYVRTCQRRFAADCKTVFKNQLNFRGFPYVPGKLSA